MHVLLPEHAVDKVTDELGLALSDMTCVERVTEDATFNLNKIISTAKTFQRVERSPKLLSRHLVQAAQLLNMPQPVSLSETELRKLPGSHEPLFFRPSTEVDLYDLTHGVTSERTLQPLALEISLSSEHASLDKPVNPHSLPPTLHRYLSVLCSQIASTESSLREEALAELRTSARVALVLPFLLQFIDVRLRDNVLLSANVVQLLIAYKSILENQSIYLDPFIPNLLDECYSMCCDWTESRETASDTVRVIEHSSDVAAFIILKLEDRNARYYDKYTHFCVETIESDELSLSALGSLTLLSKLGPQCVMEKVVPLIFGNVYKDVFTESETQTVDQTAQNIRRILQHSLFSLYRALYQSLHDSKIRQLITTFNSTHNRYAPATQPNHPSPPQAPTLPNSSVKPDTQPAIELLKYCDIAEKLGASSTMVTPNWEQMKIHPVLLAKRQTKKKRKKLKAKITKFGSAKGLMLPPERRAVLMKKADKGIRANQIYNMYNNFSPLNYFL